VVTQPSVPIRLALPVEHKIFEIGNGESNKSITTVENLCSGFADMGLTRNDLVIGVGGGMVTDVAGFAAAVFHRGVRVMHVATTLLAMVDAAIGGKTGVNLSAGKNLVGAFWQPSAVFCEMDALSTLPPEHMRGGLGELAKYHFISGDDFLSLDMQQRIARAVRIKADIVAADERESGQRALLNYGHTLGHAVEITPWSGVSTACQLPCQRAVRQMSCSHSLQTIKKPWMDSLLCLIHFVASRWCLV
jgi:5-deoxy-5-amino-3-dehydroquinate synthase